MTVQDNPHTALIPWRHIEDYLTAASIGDREGVENFLKKYPHGIEVTGMDGWTALHYAAWVGDKKLAEYLIGRGADINVCAKNGETPLIIAIFTAHEDIANTLLDRGARWKKERDAEGMTAFLTACVKGVDGIMRRLIAAGADKNERDNAGATGLIHASRWGHKSTVQGLLSANVDTSVTTNEGLTAIEEAERAKHFPIAAKIRTYIEADEERRRAEFYSKVKFVLPQNLPVRKIVRFGK